MSAWTPALGATLVPQGARFRVWAPAARTLDVVLEGGGAAPRPLDHDARGMFTATVDGVAAGARYRYLIDGEGPFPDPASRWQPDGVHGPSAVVDPDAFTWTDRRWGGVALADLVIYEVHVGAFSPAGTFAAVAERLDAIAALGVTAIELMPVAEFAGRRNWGYDGAALFAPSRSYGAPDDLRRLVDAAHARGLAVLLDVVYNHFGPDGAYIYRYSPQMFTTRHRSPWGAGVDLDGPRSREVRDFFIENALMWVHEYHLDGLRLDATHALRDTSARHFIAELAARVHESVSDRHVHVIAEDDRNMNTIVLPRAEGGWGLDAVWADDLHHQLRRALAGDRDGYFADYSGTTRDIAATIRQGWFYTGQFASHLRAPRGTSPAGLPPARFVVCLQNHDQVGNRAFGERLHQQIDATAYRAASVLLCLLPHTPLLFMGQEWAASAPFLYFTDHQPELGRLVTEGRRREFAAFDAFADPAARAAIPDPQALSSFEVSTLDWPERDEAAHAATLQLYTALLQFRRRSLAPGSPADAASALALDADTLGLRRTASDGDHVLVVVRLRGAGAVDLGPLMPAGAGAWTTVLTSEDERFSDTGAMPIVNGPGDAPVVHFAGPAGVVLRVAAVQEERAA